MNIKNLINYQYDPLSQIVHEFYYKHFNKNFKKHDKRQSGFYIDIGCNHPIFSNFTNIFYKNKWNGICLDVNNKYCKDWKKLRPRDIFINKAVGRRSDTINFYFFKNSKLTTSSKKYKNRYTKKCDLIKKKKISCTTMTKLIIDFKISKIDLLKIDVEGTELNVLKGLDLKKVRPKIIVIEIKNLQINNLNKNDVFLYLKSNNYEMIIKTHLDAVFICKNTDIYTFSKKIKII